MNKAEGQDNHTGNDSGSATEYFCCACFQLRLSLKKDKTRCGNCGSEHIITGFVGELDKPALLKEYRL